MTKLNKGEWSESYTFVKLLGDKSIVSANEDSKNSYYPIISILKNQDDRIFIIDNIKNQVMVNSISLNKTLTIVSCNDFIHAASDSLNVILNSEKTFEITDLEEFLYDLGIQSLKESNSSKPDITMEIEDIHTSIQDFFDFSIKSYLGSNPTLLNASNATDFEYNLSNFSNHDLEKALLYNKKTSKKWLKERMGYLVKKHNKNELDLNFTNIPNTIFYNNLCLIDSQLPLILSDLLLDYYSTEGISDIKTLTERLSERNPLNINRNNCNNFYKKNIIELIKAVTFGMQPNTPWDYCYSVNGGLIIVLKNGNIVLYHTFYDSNCLDEYLFTETKLETPSSTRYHMGEIYDDYSFTLNLQIRMK